MKKFRSIQLACLLLCLICFFLSGCGSKSKPDEDALSLCKVVLQEDKDSASKFELDNLKLHDEMLTELTEKLSKTMVTKEQAKRISESFLNALKRVNVSAKTISEDGNNAEVELTITPIDINVALEGNGLRKELENRVSANPSDSEIAELITQIMVEKVDNAVPTGEKKLTVSCTYDKKLKAWVPSDVKKFSEQLLTTALCL